MLSAITCKQFNKRIFREYSKFNAKNNFMPDKRNITYYIPLK